MPTTQVVVPQTQSSALTLFGDTPANAVGALRAAMNVIEGGGEMFSLFPGLTVSGGANGGLMVPVPGVPDEIADTLPQGRRAFDAVFLDYRLSIVAWPVGYNDRTEEVSKPCYSAAINAVQPEDAALVMRCCKNYQYTKGANKNKFDFATSRVGHIRPQVEMLVYLPDPVNGLVIVSCAANYGSVERTFANIDKLVDEATQKLGRFPCSIRPVSEEASAGQFTWKIHSLEITPSTNTASPAWPAYGTWLNAARLDPAVVNTVSQWVSAADRPMTDEIRAALRIGISL